MTVQRLPPATPRVVWTASRFTDPSRRRSVMPPLRGRRRRRPALRSFHRTAGGRDDRSCTPGGAGDSISVRPPRDLAGVTTPTATPAARASRSGDRVAWSATRGLRRAPRKPSTRSSGCPRVDRRSEPSGPQEEIRSQRDFRSLRCRHVATASDPRDGRRRLLDGGRERAARRARARAHGVECPRVCFLPTASGDADHYIVRFYRAFAAGRCQPSHVSLFRRDGGAADLAGHLLRAGPRVRGRREPDLAARHLGARTGSTRCCAPPGRPAS